MCLPLLTHIPSVYLHNRLWNTFISVEVPFSHRMFNVIWPRPTCGNLEREFSERNQNAGRGVSQAVKFNCTIIHECPCGCVKNVCWSLTIDGLKFCVRPEHLSVTFASLPVKFLALIKCKYLQISLTLCLIHCIINSSCRTQMYNNC